MDIENDYQHQPVMLQETLAALVIRMNGAYVDATLGRGGHAKALLEQLGQSGRLLAIDKDPEAITSAQHLFGNDPRVMVQHGSFAMMGQFAKQHELVGKVNGILIDLGVSSPQLEDPQRGFSFLKDGPLDMRMDNTRGQTAAQWINSAKEEEISQVLHDFGEERFARRIARAIVAERKLEPIQTTGRLAAIVSDANPAWEKYKHPATRVFQAIRIFINQELKDLQVGLEQALEILAVGGRLVVLSFHSLEDRIVKRFMRYHSQNQTPLDIPILIEEGRPKLKILGRGIKPTAQEIAMNPRSRSAVLRVAEKLA